LRKQPWKSYRDLRIGQWETGTPNFRAAWTEGVRSGDLVDLMKHARSKIGLIFSILRSFRSCDLVDLIDLIGLSGLIW